MEGVYTKDIHDLVLQKIQTYKYTHLDESFHDMVRMVASYAAEGSGRWKCLVVLQIR